ncbi:unnamed protein product [Adineta ricciae]|uniref:Uncharacterized protein n=1 Tax=Adineta ricciae TaxID=249248 RepID=A0A813YUB2_ADIRI|nr:unnamed protein product [Adineta ricciae]
MPSWKINCLKSEDHGNLSTLPTNTINESNQLDSILSSIEHDNADTAETITAIDIHSLPSSPTTLSRRDQKQRYRPYSPIPTLEPSPSFVAVTPISKSTANQSSRSSPFEQRLAKFRSLPLLWLRTCGASQTQPKRRPPIGTIGNNTIYSTFGQFGELNHPEDLLFEDIVFLKEIC